MPASPSSLMAAIAVPVSHGTLHPAPPSGLRPSAAAASNSQRLLPAAVKCAALLCLVVCTTLALQWSQKPSAELHTSAQVRSAIKHTTLHQAASIVSLKPSYKSLASTHDHAEHGSDICRQLPCLRGHPQKARLSFQQQSRKTQQRSRKRLQTLAGRHAPHL